MEAYPKTIRPDKTYRRLVGGRIRSPHLGERALLSAVCMHYYFNEVLSFALCKENADARVHKVPAVKGLEEYMQRFPNKVSHSKSYRMAHLYSHKRVLIIGNSASGHDITTMLLRSGKLKLPIYQSRRSRSFLDGAHPPEGIEWKPVIKEYNRRPARLFSRMARSWLTSTP